MCIYVIQGCPNVFTVGQIRQFKKPTGHQHHINWWRHTPKKTFDKKKKLSKLVQTQ